MPPHCPHCPTVGPVGPTGGADDVLVEVIGGVGTTELEIGTTEDVGAVPLQEKTAGPTRNL